LSETKLIAQSLFGAKNEGRLSREFRKRSTKKKNKEKEKLKCSADLIFNLEYYFSVSDD